MVLQRGQTKAQVLQKSGLNCINSQHGIYLQKKSLLHMKLYTLLNKSLSMAKNLHYNGQL